MSLFVIMVIALVATALVGALIVVGRKASKLGEEFEQSALQLASLHDERRVLLEKIEAMQDAERKMIGEFELQPESKRKTYRILALGVKGTGKTSLTLKWANPLADLSSISDTKIERYERSVSRVRTATDVTEHVFEVHDCGGEHMVDAVQELSTEDVHGLLLVVDLGGKEATHIDQERINTQLQELQPQSLRYFFVPKMMASCKTVVLFINKSDVILGSPAQVEDQAKQLYQPLIDSLRKYAGQVDVKVFVGSANYGHSTHLLFSHFIEKILPKTAYDHQLLQRIKVDTAASTTAPFGLSAPPLPPIEPSTNAPSFMAKPSPRQNTLRGPTPFILKSKGAAEPQE